MTRTSIPAGLKIAEDVSTSTYLTGMGRRPSMNRKTGPMVQAWILPNMSPTLAAATYQDEACCGTCPLRGPEGACYVNLAHGPEQVYHTYHAEPVAAVPDLPRPVRIGAYGDPVYIPADVYERLTGPGHTSYTHAWARPEAAHLRPGTMASIDVIDAARYGRTIQEHAAAAQERGWRTYRHTVGPTDTPGPGEAWCPYYTSGGRVQCIDCGLCNGADGTGKNILAPAHGLRARALQEATQ